MYSYLSHRVAGRAGQLDAQQGTVTAVVSSGFAETDRDRAIAARKQAHCNRKLPSDRFDQKISLHNSPVSCRIEVVYSVDYIGKR
jgi:hypothetical protein